MVNQVKKQQNGTSTFTCSICSRKFSEESHFNKHKRGALCKKLAQRTAKKNLKKKLIIKKSSSNEKKRNAPFVKPYQCNICAEKFFDKGNVELHLERQHQAHKDLWVELNTNCNECERWFSNVEDLKEHQKQHRSFLHGTNNEPQSSSSQRLPVVNTPVSNIYNNHDPSVLPYTIPQDQMNTHTQSHLSSNLMSMPSSSSLHIPHALPFNSGSFPQSNCHIMPNTNQWIPLQPMSVPSQISSSVNLNCNETTQPESTSMPTQIRVNTVSNSASTSSLNKSISNEDKNQKSNYFDKFKTVSSAKLYICGECGHKFIDVINLEIHIQRKHPNSKVLQTINISGGTVIYKTNNTSKNVICFVDDDKPRNSQSYNCLLCGYKTTILNTMISHLQGTHNTTNPNLFHVLENLDSKKSTSPSKINKKIKTEPDSPEMNHKCESCSLTFSSKAELVRHRIKDKQYMCGVCCFSSCSQTFVETHMANHSNFYSNSTSIDSSPQGIGLPNLDSTKQCNFSNGGMLCWICGFLAASVSSLDEHLKSHGSAMIECRSCCKTCNSLAVMAAHVLAQHSQQHVGLTFVLTPIDAVPVIHNLVVNPDRTISVATVVNNPTIVSNSNITSKVENINNDDDVELCDEVYMSPSYACNICKSCYFTPSHLETHIRAHQNINPTDSTIENIDKTNASVHKVEGTLKFLCEECGYWREDGDPVMRHINAVHLSGKMLHSIKLPSGKIEIYPIHIVSPINGTFE